MLQLITIFKKKEDLFNANYPLKRLNLVFVKFSYQSLCGLEKFNVPHFDKTLSKL